MPREAPGPDFDKDKDYQLERALDVLRAGGDLTQLAAAPTGIVVTDPNAAPVETAEATGTPPTEPVRAPDITPGNIPTPQERRR